MNEHVAEILSKLIQFDTVSHKSNLPILDWIEARLVACGARTERVFDDTGEKANLIASFGPSERAGYVLSGHVDVVPVDGQPWTRDPFGGEIADGRVWGRGASDMKGFVACMIAAAPKIAASSLSRPIHMCFSHDEEVGCIGVRTALRRIAEWETTPLGCIVGEPTRMAVVVGHKGKRAERATFRGTTAHSSLAPTAVNAAEFAARLAVFVSDMGRRFAEAGPRDGAYDVAHSTAHVGVLKGGVALNIVPDEAVVEFEVRAIADDDPNAAIAEAVAYARETLEPAMRRIAPEASIAFDTLTETAGLETPPDADIVRFAKRLAGRNDHEKVAFGTEAGLFTSMAAVPAVVIGPGDIDRAHKADEFIELSELAACEAFLERFIAECAA